MDINNWNDIAHKADRTANRYSQGFTSLRKKIDGNEFICPWCGKQYMISDAEIMKIVAGKDLIDTQYNFNSTTKTYVKTTYKVRFCKKFFSKNARNKHIFFTIGKIIYALLGILLLYWLITTDEKLGFYGWVGAIFGYGIIALCALGLKDSIEENLFDTANINEAYKNNAIV